LRIDKRVMVVELWEAMFTPGGVVRLIAGCGPVNGGKGGE
jgi:hypothetical protein